MRRYSKEFKKEALRLSDEIGVKKASENLGIRYCTLSCWRRNRKAEKESLKYVLIDDETRLRIVELERENTVLKKANYILKEALGFYAKDRNK